MRHYYEETGACMALFYVLSIVCTGFTGVLLTIFYAHDEKIYIGIIFLGLFLIFFIMFILDCRGYSLLLLIEKCCFCKCWYKYDMDIENDDTDIENKGKEDENAETLDSSFEKSKINIVVEIE